MFQSELFGLPALTATFRQGCTSLTFGHFCALPGFFYRCGCVLPPADLTSYPGFIYTTDIKVAGHYVYETIQAMTALRMLVPISQLHPLKWYTEAFSSSHSSCSCFSALCRVKLIHTHEKSYIHEQHLWFCIIDFPGYVINVPSCSLKVEAYLWFYVRNTEIKVTPTWSQSKIKYRLENNILRLFLTIEITPLFS